MKKLSAYLYGAWKSNLGDDLFIKAITQRYPNCEFHILVNKRYIGAYTGIDNLVVHTKNGWLTRFLNNLFRKMNKPDFIFYRMARYASVVVLLGGSLYQQEDNWKKIYLQRKRMISLFDESFAIGNNFGPSSDPEFINCYKSFFIALTDVCFRDRQSQMIFPYQNVRSASDVVFGINTYSSNKAVKSSCYHADKPCAVVSVIDLCYKSISRKYKNVSADIYEKWIANLIHELENRGYYIILMGFCTSEGDESAIDRIINSNSFRDTTKYIHHNVEESLAVLRDSEIVVATRFHSMILGWTLGKKVVPVVYGNKMQQVINDTGFDGCCVDIEEVDKYDPSSVLDHAKKLDNIDFYANDSKNQFIGFDKWIESKGGH